MEAVGEPVCARNPAKAEGYVGGIRVALEDGGGIGRYQPSLIAAIGRADPQLDLIVGAGLRVGQETAVGRQGTVGCWERLRQRFRRSRFLTPLPALPLFLVDDAQLAGGR
jgi:hypothetical protein